MGKLNLLKNLFSGKVGSIYGVEQNKKAIVKAVPFSHTPHNKVQNDCAKAFVLLNRFASTIAKHFWKYLGLSDRTMYKNNAVAKWLSPLVATHIFTPAPLSNIIPADGTLLINTFTLNPQTGEYNIKLSNSPLTWNIENEPAFVGIFTDKNKALRAGKAIGTSIEWSGVFDLENINYIYAVAFKATLQGKKYTLQGCCVSEKKEIT